MAYSMRAFNSCLSKTEEYACSRQRSGRNFSISSASARELQGVRSGLPVNAIPGGDAAGLMLVGFATNLLGGLLGLGRRRSRGGGRRGGRSRSRRRGSGRLDLDRGGVAGGSGRLGEPDGNLGDRLRRFGGDGASGGGGRGDRGKARQTQAAGFAGLGGSGGQQQGRDQDQFAHVKSPLFDGWRLGQPPDPLCDRHHTNL